MKRRIINEHVSTWFEKKSQNFLLYWGEKIDDLKSLIAAIIEINNKLYEQTLKNRFYDSRGRADTYVGAKRDNAFRYGKQRDPHYGTTPMELNSVKRGKGKPLRKKQEKQSCYKCDKSKHFAKNCKSKNVMLKRQLNAMLKIKFEQKNKKKFLKRIYLCEKFRTFSKNIERWNVKKNV